MIDEKRLTEWRGGAIRCDEKEAGDTIETLLKIARAAQTIEDQIIARDFSEFEAIKRFKEALKLLGEETK